jgi:uncharacterized protein (TIGR02594 family)
MRTAPYNAYFVAEQYLGIEEVAGANDNPLILAMLKADNSWPEHDEVPWCSAFVNFVCWQLDLPRTENLRARSWLTIGEPIALEVAVPGFDVVIFKRGAGDQPGPEVIDAPGHVAFYKTTVGNQVEVIGGNQGDAVSVARYPADRVIGVRRLR